MALVTRCPNCATAFRVTPQHLEMQGGNVRCGHCSQVFNSFSALTTVKESETDDFLKAPDTGTQKNTREATSAKDLSAPVSSDQTVLQPDSGITAKVGTLEALSTEMSAEEESIPEASDVTSASQENYTFDTVLLPRSSRIWGLVSIFLLVVLTGQIVYLFRTELLIIAPGTKPYLEQYCEILNCTIPLPQQAELLSIESSDMQMDTAQHPGVITLTATVRNQAPFPQAFPAFELTLTDTQDRTLASRIFTPSEYLEENVNPSKAIAPSNKISVTLYIDSGDLNAAGYRLLLLYP